VLTERWRKHYYTKREMEAETAMIIERGRSRNMHRMWLPGLLMGLCVILVAGPACALEAIEELLDNEVVWHADGTITAQCYRAEALAGVHCNWWIDLTTCRAVGQTFRCAGPRLAGVQLGLGSLSGAPGLTYRETGPSMTVSLYRGGPGGDLVAQKQFPPEQITDDLPLVVDFPSDPETVWYYEVVADRLTTTVRKNNIKATEGDVYPHGRMYLDGRPVDGDLHLRVHRASTCTGARTADAVLWSAPPEERLWPDANATADLMLREGAQGPLRLTVARNEWVSAQITASPAPDFQVSTVDLAVGPWTGPAGATDGSLQTRVEWLRYSLEYYRDRTKERLYPDPLAPTSHAELSPDLAIEQPNTTFWVSVYAPASAAPGIYKSTVTATVNGTLPLQMPVEIEVWDFALPRETHTRTGLFRATGGTLERHLWWTEDLADFRIAMGYPFHREEHGILRKSDFSEEAYQQVLGPKLQSALVRTAETLNERGLQLTMVCPWGDTYRVLRGEPEAGYEGMRRFWEAYYPILQANGWIDQAYARMPDELGPDRIDQAREMAAKTREWAPGVKLMVTSMGTPDATKLSRGVGIADIWCPSSRYVLAAADFYKGRQQEGEQVWPYIHDFLFHVSDPAGARLFFWMLQKHGFEGVSYWSLGPRGQFEHAPHGIVRRDDVRQGDGTLYYPGTEDANVQGLWRSARLHHIRDGLEDREYFWLIDQLLSQAEARGAVTPEVAARVAAARSFPEQLTFRFSNFVHRPELVEECRREMASLIVELQRLAEEP